MKNFYRKIKDNFLRGIYLVIIIFTSVVAVNAATINTYDSESGDAPTLNTSEMTNEAYLSICENPYSGGTIAADQAGISPFNPAEITNLSLPVGYRGGVLVYKWQSSTTSATSGFTDIAGTNSATYDPGVVTQATWFKRLAIVDCMDDWTGAAESNVVKMTIVDLAPAITFASINSGEMSVKLAFNAVGLFQIDWGNGILVSQTANTVYTTYSTSSYTTGTTVKIYGSGITKIDVSSKNLTSLNVSACTMLTDLQCSFNPLIALDVSKNTALTNLYCNSSQLTTLDVSKNTALNYLNCTTNNLAALDISKNTMLIKLYCYDNQITDLDVSKNTALTLIWCTSNKLTTLNVSKNTALSILECTSNQLTTLDVSNNSALTELYCSQNQLTVLDVRNNTALTRFMCSYNQLNYSTLPQKKSGYIFYYYAPQANFPASVTNGVVNLSSQLTARNATGATQTTVYKWYTQTSNTLLIPGTDYSEKDGVFAFLKTPSDSVYCTMDNSAFPNFSGANVFRTVNLKVEVSVITLTSENSGALSLDLEFSVPDNSFYIDWGDGILIPLTTKNYVMTYSATSYIAGRTVKVYGSGITKFDAHLQNLTSLDVTACSTLTQLDCKRNKLTALDVTKNTVLTSLWCDGNRLETLDVSKNIALENLFCNNNLLSNLDLRKNTGLTILNSSYNQLSTLNLSENIAMTGLHCGNNQLDTLDLSKNLALTILVCTGNELKMLNLSKCKVLAEIYCSGNQLTTLDISNNAELTYLDCRFNQLTSLDVSKNLALTSLLCGKNNLIALDVSKNINLHNLYCFYNQLRTLDVSNNKLLTELDFFSNQLKTLDVSKNEALTFLLCTNNQLNYSTLPQKKSRYSTYMYATQANFAASATNGVVDLSSQLTAKDVSDATQTTVYKWYTKTGTALAAGIDYNEANGVFTFLKNPADSVYCTLENGAFPDFTGADVLRTVNLKVVVCTNPTSGGTIAANQSGCSPFDPTEITSVAFPSGHLGTLEYKWQRSTTSAITGFADISGTNAAAFNPGNLAVTTWYKRLARVECMADWTGAAESNVVTITVNPQPEAPVAGVNSFTYSGTVKTATATVGVGETVDWYANATGTTTVSAPTGINVGTYSAYAEARNTTTGCVSAKRTLITLDIKQATLTVTADNKNRLYGRANPVLTFSYSGFSAGEDSSTLDVLPVASTLATRDSDVGSYAIVVSGGSDNNYDILYRNGKLDIEQGNANIIAENKTMRYGDSIPELTIRYEFFDAVGKELKLDHKITAWVDADSIKGPGTYPIHISGGKDNNYALFYIGGTLTVEKALLTVTSEDKTITYGEQVPELTYTIDGFLKGDKDSVLLSKPTIAVNTGAGVNAGVYDIVASGGSDEFYEFDYRIGKLTVKKAPLTVTAVNATSTVGTIPTFDVTYSGFVNGETKEVIDTLARVTTTATTASPSRTYPITVSGGSDNNYEFSYINGQLWLIEKVTPVISWVPSNLTYGVKLGREQLNATCNAEGTLFYELAEGTLLNAGEKQELKVTFEPFDTISTNKISKSVYVDVQKAVLTVKANDKIVNYGDTLPVLSFSYSGFINDENAGVLDVLPTITSIDGVDEAGTYPIMVSGGADNNYNFEYENGTLTVKPRLNPVVIWETPSDITYGTALSQVQLNAKTDVAGTFVYTPSAGTVFEAGKSQPIIVQFTPADTLTYAVVADTAFVTVGKATLTVKANDVEMNAGETIPEFTLSYSGFVNGDDISDIDKLPVATSTVKSATIKSVYEITVSGGEDNNYSFVYKSGNLIVNSGVGVDAMKSISMSVYPNPFTDKVTISSEFNGDGSYQLTDLTGKVISNGQVEDGNTNIMLSHIRKGVYLLQVKMGEGNRTFRLVKQ